MIPNSVSRRKALATLAGSVVLGLGACETSYVAQGPSLDAGAPVQVALLLPAGSGISGDEVVSQSLKQAADLAVADLQGVKIDLRVYNTGSDPAGAAQAAVRAVDEGAKIILGPVYAEAANAAGVAVAARGVSVLSFSNNPDIAGGNVFVLGPTFQNTANRLAAYAARQGKGRIVVVHDKTTSGTLAARAVASAAARTGATVVGNAAYDFSQQGVVAAIPSIVSTVRGSGADAILLTADTAGALPLLTQLLPEAGVNPAVTKFIGLTRWDIPPATLSLPGLQGGWFALPDPGTTAQFEARYAAAYGTPPHPIAGLAYDGIAAIGALARSGNPDALSPAGLTQPSGFAGVNGVFRLLADGTNQRGLAIATVQNGQISVIDPAPRSFGGAGL
jgi:ABC-type branched-subunit amino acid transport system substrate-binding protein